MGRGGTKEEGQRSRRKLENRSWTTLASGSLALVGGERCHLFFSSRQRGSIGRGRRHGHERRGLCSAGWGAKKGAALSFWDQRVGCGISFRDTADAWEGGARSGGVDGNGYEWGGSLSWWGNDRPSPAQPSQQPAVGCKQESRKKQKTKPGLGPESRYGIISTVSRTTRRASWNVR